MNRTGEVMKLIKVNECITYFEDILDIIESYTDNPEDFICGMVGISDNEIRLVDTVSNVALAIPLNADGWDADSMPDLLANTSVLSINLSRAFMSDLDFDEGDYTIWDIIPMDLSEFDYASIKIGSIKEIKKADNGVDLDVFNSSYWADLTGQRKQSGNTQSPKSSEVNRQSNNNSISQVTQKGVDSNYTQVSTASQNPQSNTQVNSSKMQVRTGIAQAFKECENINAQEKEMFAYIYKTIFKHNLNLGNPMDDFKYDLIGVERYKYTDVYVIKTPQVTFDTVFKSSGKVSAIFSPSEVFKVEETYNRVPGVYAIHVNKDASIMSDTQLLMDFYLKRNKFADEDIKFGDPTQIVLGFAPSGLVAVDSTSAGACHFLVAGTTGSGKSVTIQALIAQYIADGAMIFYFDPKESDSTVYKDYNIAVACTEEDMLLQMKKVYKLYQAQKAKVGEFKDFKTYNKRNPETQLRRIVVIFDEYESFITKLKGKKDKLTEIDVILTDLAAKGRSIGVNVIMGSQTPSADYFNKSIRNNLQVKLLGAGCGGFFKNFEMVGLDTVPANPANDPYRYSGMFTCSNTRGKIKSLYIEAGDPSEEYGGRTEQQYLLDTFNEQGLIIETANVLANIELDSEDEDGDVVEAEIDDDFFDDLAKPAEYDDEDELSDDNVVEMNEPLNSSINQIAEASTQVHAHNSPISSGTNPQVNSSQKHTKANPNLSNTDRYKRDNKLNAREKQMMAEYFDLIDQSTKRLPVPSSEVPLILTGKSAKIPDTTMPKYNLFSSFSFKNKIKAKAINFIGKFSSGIADKLRYSIGLENNVAKKATYIFLHTFSKSRRLDNIKSLALCKNTQTIYINDIPRLLDGDIIVNDSGPYAEKYGTINPENFFYPEIENLSNLETLMFDCAAMAYKAMDQINTVVFGNDGKPGVDILFDCQPNLRTVTIYDKVYYNSNKKARALLNKVLENPEEMLPREVHSTGSLLSDANYQDEISAFYEEQAKIKLEEEQAEEKLKKIREDERQKLSNNEEITGDTPLDIRLKINNTDMAPTSGIPESDESLDISLKELEFNINEVELDVAKNELRDQSEDVKEFKDILKSERVAPESNTYKVEIEGLLIDVSEYGSIYRKEYGADEVDEVLSESRGKLFQAKMVRNPGETNVVFKYPDPSTQSVVQTVLLSRALELTDVNDDIGLHTSYVLENNQPYCVTTEKGIVSVSTLDLKYFCIEIFRNVTGRTLRNALITIAHIFRYNTHAVTTDNIIVAPLLAYILANKKDAVDSIVTDNSDIEHLSAILMNYDQTSNYIISTNEHPLLQNIKEPIVTQDVLETLKELLKTLVHISTPDTLLQTIKSMIVDYNFEGQITGIETKISTEEEYDIEESYPEPEFRISGAITNLLGKLWEASDVELLDAAKKARNARKAKMMLMGAEGAAKLFGLTQNEVITLRIDDLKEMMNSGKLPVITIMDKKPAKNLKESEHILDGVDVDEKEVAVAKEELSIDTNDISSDAITVALINDNTTIENIVDDISDLISSNILNDVRYSNLKELQKTIEPYEFKVEKESKITHYIVNIEDRYKEFIVEDIIGPKEIINESDVISDTIIGHDVNYSMFNGDITIVNNGLGMGGIILNKELAERTLLTRSYGDALYKTIKGSKPAKDTVVNRTTIYGVASIYNEEYIQYTVRLHELATDMVVKLKVDNPVLDNVTPDLIDDIVNKIKEKLNPKLNK